jgi:pimeloyl-ACP methyl ester carboxylesterase
VAEALAADPAQPRLVLALDYRGHGQSQYDRNPENYTLPVALSDLTRDCAVSEDAAIASSIRAKSLPGSAP